MEALNDKINVVILTYKPKDDFVLSLNLLLKQTIFINKIIIMNTNEKLFYKNITDVKNLKNILSNDIFYIEHINEIEFDHGATRNYAIRKFTSDYVLCMTDDAIPYDANLIMNLYSTFKKYNNVAASYARQIPKSNAHFKEKIIREFNYPNEEMYKDKNTIDKYKIKNYFCSNVCAMYDTKIFMKLNCFKENLILNEDMVYAYTAINNNYSIVYNNNAIVLHSHNYSYISQFKRNFDIGVSQIYFSNVFNDLSSENEGKKLFLFFIKKCLKEFKIIEIFDFIFECLFRYIGYYFGKHFYKLPYGLCMILTSNRNYFKKNYKELYDKFN